MSSVYGPALLKPPSVEDNIDEAVGRKKNPGAEFETDHDRAKRIRRERRAAKDKEKDVEQKMQMNQAIRDLLGGKAPKAPAGPTGPPGPVGPTFVSFGPGMGPSVGPDVGPSAGPSVGVAGPAGPSVGPTVPGESAPSSPPTAGSEAAQSAPGPAPKPRGPARPKPEDLPEKPDEQDEKAPDRPAAPVRLGHMDVYKEQKRVSWDELKNKLAEANWKEEGVPGSNAFEDYSQKLEKARNERLAAQEEETKRMLKQATKGKKDKKKDKKEKKPKGPKRTADGAILAASSDDSQDEEEDALLARYKAK